MVKITRRTLRNMFPPEPRIKRKHCRICLAPEEFDGDGNSSLAGGECLNTVKCQERQPRLFGEGK